MQRIFRGMLLALLMLDAALALAQEGTGALETVAVPGGTDLLHCPLAVITHTLGDASSPSDVISNLYYSATAISGPVRTDQGFLVFFVNADQTTTQLVATTMQDDGTLLPSHIVPTSPPVASVEASSDGHQALVAGTSLYPNDIGFWLGNYSATTGFVDWWPPAGIPFEAMMAQGPRGLALAYPENGDSAAIVLVRPGLGTETVTMREPRPYVGEVPRNFGVVAGTDLDLVLSSRPESDGHHILEAFVFPADPAQAPSRVPIATSPQSFEAAIAASDSGFAVVWTDSDLQGLWFQALDASATPVGEPVEFFQPLDGIVSRYPQITSLAEGWAISFWDGEGASLVRVDARGTSLEDPLPIRSGDEIGGHTNAPMASTPDGLAMVWLVGQRQSAVTQDTFDTPFGPRIALIRCAE
jgi:hypothetical protein